MSEVQVSKVTLREAAAELEEFWSQHTVGEATGNLFKVAKGIGSTNWHSHDQQDEVLDNFTAAGIHLDEWLTDSKGQFAMALGSRA